MNNNKIALVVIVYGKALEDALTIQSLLGFERKLDHLLIVNNGPTVIDENSAVLPALVQKHHHVVLENQVQNKPLSWIYNDFIQQYDADRYAVFDDDTMVSREYCEKILFDTESYHLGLPSIRSSHDGKAYYPVISSSPKETQEGYYQYDKGTYSIGSGLIISRDLKKTLIDAFGGVFDHHFAFYGVDISLFRRLDKLQYSDQFIVNTRAELSHHLSKFNNEISDFRKKELLIDQILQFRWYRTNTKYIFRIVAGMLLKLRIAELRLVIKTFIEGKHPRC